MLSGGTVPSLKLTCGGRFSVGDFTQESTFTDTGESDQDGTAVSSFRNVESFSLCRFRDRAFQQFSSVPCELHCVFSIGSAYEPKRR